LRPSINASTAATSCADNTTGSRRRGCGRAMVSIQGSCTPSTFPYKNSSSDNACRWVLTDTPRSLASQVRKASTSGPPISAG